MNNAVGWVGRWGGRICQQSEHNAAALIIFQLILTYVPQTDCVAFTALPDQMFHFADVTSNLVSSRSLSGAESFNYTKLKRENEGKKQNRCRGNN